MKVPEEAASEDYLSGEEKEVCLQLLSCILKEVPDPSMNLCNPRRGFHSTGIVSYRLLSLLPAWSPGSHRSDIMSAK